MSHLIRVDEVTAVSRLILSQNADELAEGHVRPVPGDVGHLDVGAPVELLDRVQYHGSAQHVRVVEPGVGGAGMPRQSGQDWLIGVVGPSLVV